MLLLVTDTSGKHGSVGLVRAADGTGDIQLIESVPLAGGTFSAQLVPQIAGLLGKHGLSKHDVDAFVVISGPGSFTGLRVGLAAIKALAVDFEPNDPKLQEYGMLNDGLVASMLRGAGSTTRGSGQPFAGSTNGGCARRRSAAS